MNETNYSALTIGPDGLNIQKLKKFWQEKSNKVAFEKLNTRVDEVHSSLLSAVKPVDYHLASEIANTAEVKSKHYIVSTIEELLKLTKSLKFGLCVRHEHVYAYNGQYWKPINASEFKVFLGKVAHR